MRVDEFGKLLVKLAALHESRGDSEEAAGLRKLAELFDGRQGTVSAFVREVRQVRGMTRA